MKQTVSYRQGYDQGFADALSGEENAGMWAETEGGAGLDGRLLRRPRSRGIGPSDPFRPRRDGSEGSWPAQARVSHPP